MGGSPLEQDSSPGQQDRVEYSPLPKAAQLTAIIIIIKKKCVNQSLHRSLAQSAGNKGACELAAVPAGWFPRSRAIKVLSRLSC